MTAPRLRLCTALALPARGASVRVAVGDNVLVLEAVRGAYAVLWHRGQEARRYVLGLPRVGSLELALRAPRHPVRLLLRETLVLAPRARVAGYVQIPLVPTVVWHGGGAPAETLLEVLPPNLEAEWDDDRAVHCATSPWLVRFPVPGGEPRAIVPLRIQNATDATMSPDHVELRLHDENLHELRGSIVGTPVRQLWGEAGWSGVPQRAAEVTQ